MGLTIEQLRRANEALVETLDRIEKVSAKRMFDASQESAKQKELTFLEGHATKLRKMMGII